LAYDGAVSRGVLQVNPSATGARNYSQCDSMLIGDQVGVNASSRDFCFSLRAVPVLMGHRPWCIVHGDLRWGLRTIVSPGTQAAACTYPYINVREPSANVEHEASTSKIGEEQLFYMQQRGLDMEEAVGMIISGFCREVFNELPLEFAAEVNQLMSLKLEGSVG
jgi:Fe-S cluster assembly scaffold protein SufB